ncbi:hypothetical protein BU17DRAFT_57239, partial [Hysterangium stoloniferum]
TRAVTDLYYSHSSKSPPSVQALKLLRSALESPYPPSTQPPKPPLEFNLEVVENTPPTADQLSTILNYTNKPISSFLSAHPTSTGISQPGTAQSLHTVFQTNPRAIKLPLVVNWDDGQAAVGDVEEVKRILESLRRKRDGEEKSGSDDHKPGWFT